MIKTVALMKTGELKENLTLEELKGKNVEWYWVDINTQEGEDVDEDGKDVPLGQGVHRPEQEIKEEQELLNQYFQFHELAIQDCISHSKRAKIENYQDFFYFDFQVTNWETLEPEDVTLFLGNNYLVSYHRITLNEIEKLRERYTKNKEYWKKGPSFLTYLITNALVDGFYHLIHILEDKINLLTEQSNNINNDFLNDLFDTRNSLIKLRRTVLPMKEVVYQVLEEIKYMGTKNIKGIEEQKVYFDHVYDKTIKIVELMESHLQLTLDMRDNYMTLLSHHSNSIMTTLTILTAFFTPLTLVASIWGMNYYGAETLINLKWNDGYFGLALMLIVGLGTIVIFKIKGWTQK